MSQRKLLVAGNWKMNGSQDFTLNILESLTNKLSRSSSDIAVFPPYVYLSLAKERLKSSAIQLGAQDLSSQEKGAYTGEISAAMLKDIGCKYVLVGHSERRAYHHESNELIAKKCLAAYQGGLTPILCMGETQEERDTNRTYDVITQQLQPILEMPEVLESCVLAYEPVWAIGTGKTATPEQAQEVHHFIRQQIAKKYSSIANKIRILYGGSVKADNATQIFNMPDIDGGLIGGASLKEEEFVFLCQINKA